jgi:hypothetical protein
MEAGAAAWSVLWASKVGFCDAAARPQQAADGRWPTFRFSCAGIVRAKKAAVAASIRIRPPAAGHQTQPSEAASIRLVATWW